METNGELAVKVELVNRLNNCANVLGAVAREAAAGFKGEKVGKADGGLTVKFTRAVLSAMETAVGVTVDGTHGKAGDGVTFYLRNSGNHAYLELRGVGQTPAGSRPWGHSHAVYQETSVYLGGWGYTGAETGFTPESRPLEYRTDWTVAEVEAARARYREAEEAKRAASAACGPFGDR